MQTFSSPPLSAFMHVAFRDTARLQLCSTCVLPVRGVVSSGLLSRLRVLMGGFFCPSAFPWLSLLTGLVNQRCSKHQHVSVKRVFKTESSQMSVLVLSAITFRVFPVPETLRFCPGDPTAPPGGPPAP